MPLIELTGVEHSYGVLRALQQIDLRLEAGTIGLLGPNGAGKSTLLKVLLGLIRPAHGTVLVFGLDVGRQPFEVRSRIGYMPEGDAIIPSLSALDFVTLAAELCGLPRAEAVGRAHQVLHFCGLGEARYRKLGSFSTGMKQRARLAQALVADPKLLLLDEPTSGLDPRGRDEMLELVAEIPRRTGASVIVSTHILPDVERTCDQVLVLASGRVLYAGELEPLLRTEHDVFEVRVKGDPAQLVAPLERAGCRVRPMASTLEVKVPENERAERIVAVALDVGAQLRYVAPLQRSLEKAFLHTLERDSRSSQGSTEDTAAR